MTWDKQLSQKDWDSLSEWLKSAFENMSEPPSEGNTFLSGPAADLIRSAFERFDVRGDILAKEISRCFGVDGTKALIRKRSQGGAEVVLRKCVSEDANPFTQHLTIGLRDTVLTTSIPVKLPVQINPSYLHSEFRDLLRPKTGTRTEGEQFVANQLIGFLASNTLSSLAVPLNLPAFYLPADRTGIMHAHTAVTSALIRRAPMAGSATDRPHSHAFGCSGGFSRTVDKSWQSYISGKPVTSAE